jgi:hypothetical protein
VKALDLPGLRWLTGRSSGDRYRRGPSDREVEADILAPFDVERDVDPLAGIEALRGQEARAPSV